VADKGQFDGAKILRWQGSDPAASGAACAECEARLTEAIDGLLTAEEQATFDGHLAECELCREMLADARRGVAWMELLREEAPEPSAELLERILTATPQIAAKSSGLPWRQRAVAAIRASAFAQIALQPRLAMTAAMAFFSIALTMNLTGVRLQDLSLSELRTGSLKRDFYQTNARVAQYYESLRVVYELESRVRDLRSVTDDEDAPAGVQSAPQPDGVRPATEPKPAVRQRTPPSAGTSRREEIAPSRIEVAVARGGKRYVSHAHGRMEGALV
jgi:hypothetical protein